MIIFSVSNNYDDSKYIKNRNATILKDNTNNIEDYLLLNYKYLSSGSYDYNLKDNRTYILLGNKILDSKFYHIFNDRIRIMLPKKFQESILRIIDKTNEIGAKGKVDISPTLKDLNEKLESTTKDIFTNLTPWQRVQLSRHPERPYTLDYIKAITNGDFLELHGDRNVKDDKAMIGGFGSVDGNTVMFIGQQKGRNTKQRNFNSTNFSSLALCHWKSK